MSLDQSMAFDGGMPMASVNNGIPVTSLDNGMTMTSLHNDMPMTSLEDSNPTEFHHPRFLTGERDSPMDEHGLIITHWIEEEVSSAPTFESNSWLSRLPKSFSELLRFSLWDGDGEGLHGWH